MSDRIEIHAAELQALEDELRRFREREPLVQAAIETAIEYAEIKGWERLEQESKAVRDFKLK